MPVINNPFNGKMNLDVADYRIDNGDYIDALNITKDAQGVGQDRVISNIVGNTLVPYTLPSGLNKVIGFYPDKVKNRAYYFIYNTNGYNSIVYYDLIKNITVKVLQSKTDSDGIDILNFDPSYKVTSINIFYRDEGDLLFFNDGLNPPKYININEYHGTSWKLEYLLIAKAPPVMPPKVVYENDTTITINNLRNKLFQFSYRYVYVNNEKSVWSSKSIVPLPQQPTLTLTNDNATDNARISIIFSTGGFDVKGIEVSFRETTNGLTSDWYLIKLFNKNDLSISSNDVYNFKFYNDSIYSQIDVLETSLLQDWVPQVANASELANGNVLLYAGIVEGYDKNIMNLSVTQSTDVTNYFYDQAGLLFFATVNGSDSGKGTIMNIYLYGTGINGSDGIVNTLNNAAGGYYINSFDVNGTDLSTFYETTASTSTYLVSDLLAGISAAMVLKGYTQVSLIGNHLVMSYASGFVLTSTAFKTFTNLDANNTRFSNAWNSGYQYAIQYFDAQGRTIGAQTSIGGTINTPSRNLTVDYPQINLSILNPPPLYATYYQVLRSDNTTYNKRLCWVSQSAYTGIADPINNNLYIYIGVDNINAYNLSISSTQNVVAYNYTPGDRIKFIRRYNIDNIPFNIPSQYDYEIVGTVSSFQYNIQYIPPNLPDYNTYTATGNFLKIRYPSNDINTDPANGFQFPGTLDWQHYEILLYNYSTNASLNQRFYYEFGKQYGIGNPGTANRYHFGVNQLPNGGATIPVTNGDLFFRNRKVTYSDDCGDFRSDILEINNENGPSGGKSVSFAIPVNKIINNSSFTIETQISEVVSLYVSGIPNWFTAGYFFWNKSTTLNKIISIKGTIDVVAENNSIFSLYAIVLTNDITLQPKYYISLLPSVANNLTQNVPVTFDIDKTINIPLTGKVWIVATTINGLVNNKTHINNFNFNFTILKNNEIKIIESSFNDTYNLITNSNGRPSVIDENARKTYYPTLIRFGGAYQVDTNINKLNNFLFEDFDEYDRSFGDVIRLHIRDRYLKVYQKFKVGNVPVLTQIVKDSVNNPLQANSNVLINKIQYYGGEYGIGDAATSLAWNNFSDYFVDNYRGVVCRLSQDGIVPISITNFTNAFFVPNLSQYRQELNNKVVPAGETYMGNPCIYGVFDAYTNKYILALEEINRYTPNDCSLAGTAVEHY